MHETVNITMRDTGTDVVLRPGPGPRLGDTRFRVYRDACSAGGGSFDRDLYATVAPLDACTRLVAALTGAMFVPVLAPSVSAALAARVGTLRAVEADADAACGEMDVRLASRGLALRPFQRKGIAWLRASFDDAACPIRLLADDMGLGKTIQALTAADACTRTTSALGESETRPVLVIGPAVARGVWEREARTWRPGLTVAALKGRKSFRWPAPGEMVITSWEILSAPTGTPAPGTILVLDEAQALKGAKSLRTKRAEAIAEAVRGVGGVVWALTGTPVENNAGEVCTVLATCGYTMFPQAPGSTAYAEAVAARDPAAVRGRLASIMLRREKADVMADLPAKRVHVEPCDISPEAAAELDGILAGLDVEGAAVTATETADDDIEFATMSHARERLAVAKIPDLLAIADEFEANAEPMVVMSAHAAPIDALASRPGWARISGKESSEQKTANAARFQAGELRGVACNIHAAGVAITLTHARVAVFVDRAWNPAKNAQAEDRIHRIGQWRECVIVRLEARHAMDERVSAICNEKEQVFRALIHAARVDATGGLATDAMAALAVAPAPVAPAPTPRPVAPAPVQAAPARPAFVPVGARIFPANKMRARCVVCSLMCEKGDAFSWVKDGEWASAHREGDARCVPPLVILTPTGASRVAPESVSRAFAGGNAGGAPGAREHVNAPRRGPRNARETWAARAVQMLAELDPDRARERNDVGFSAADGPEGHALAYLLPGGLTDAAWGLAINIATHYQRTQVGEAPADESAA